MHDVLIVTSQGSGGGHITRTVYAASEGRRAPNTPAELRRRADRRRPPNDQESTRLMKKKALIGGIAGLTATPVAAAPGGGW